MSKWGAKQRLGRPSATKKPKGSRLIALNRTSFDLIEIVGTRGFGPDIYYYHHRLLSSAGAAGETDVARNCNCARERGHKSLERLL